MANPTYRVNIPRNAEEVLDLAADIYQKHTDLATTSPLNAMQTHTWTENGPQVATCLDLHKQAEELSRKAEEAYRQRDLLLGNITESVKASRDLLLGIYRETPKALGDWGFDVDDSPRAKKSAE